MKNIRLYSLVSLVIICSCSSEESFEESISGRWTGVITQQDCCTFDLNVDIGTLSLNMAVATGGYFNADYSICNNDIFFCEQAAMNPSNCSFTWTLTNSTEPTITVEEDPVESVCEEGTVTLRLIDQSTMTYRWVSPTDPANTASGQLTKS